MDTLATIAHWLTELLWPARCVACGILGAPACERCLNALKPTDQRCIACGRVNRTGLPCPGCHMRTHLDRVLAATALTEPAGTFVHALKYRNIRSLSVPLADRLCDVLSLRPETVGLFGSNPIIVPVPLHFSRLRQREFNQASLLAARIAANTAMPIQESALTRVRATGQQTKTSSRLERRENMLGAFTVATPEEIVGRDVILVDDVVTTGATVEDCARALKDSGAHRVSVVAVAHG